MGKKIYRYFMSDTLYQNSIYLILSTAIQAFLGFFFWIINARLFPTADVGIATTIISVASLISSFSLLGLNAGIVSYLPASKEKNNKINTSLTLVTITAFLISLIYLWGIHTFSPRLEFIVKQPLLSLAFILIMIFVSLNMIVENIFIAYRSAKYVLYKNTILSITKILFPFFLITLGAFGIFLAYGISMFVALALSIVFLIYKFSYVFKATINKSVINRMMKFSFGNYVAGFIAQLPMNILPIIITNKIGPSVSAYFYMGMMIANLLYIVPIAVSQSLFAEGSYSEKELKIHLKKAVKIIAGILIPGILLTVFFGKYVLLAFGKQYSIEGFQFLQLIALAGIFVAINNIGTALFNIKHKIGYILVLNFINVVVTLGLSYLLISYKLSGIGLAWIIGQTVTAFVIVYLLREFFSFS